MAGKTYPTSYAKCAGCCVQMMEGVSQGGGNDDGGGIMQMIYSEDCWNVECSIYSALFIGEDPPCLH